MQCQLNMSDIQQNSPNEQDTQSDILQWVTPRDTATMLDVPVRTVYRLIERNKLTTDGASHNQKISLESIEAYRLNQLAQNALSGDNGGQEEKPRAKPQQEENRAAVMALMSMQQEREKLLTKVDELQEARRQDALQIGKMTERVANLESRIIELQAQKPAPTGSNLAETAQKVETPTQPDNGPQSGSNELPGLPTTSNKRRRRNWWERFIGGGGDG